MEDFFAGAIMLIAPKCFGSIEGRLNQLGIIFYQSTLNQRYQYHETVYEGNRNIVIFDTKKGEAYSILRGDVNNDYYWTSLSPFSKEQVIDRK